MLGRPDSTVRQVFSSGDYRPNSTSEVRYGYGGTFRPDSSVTPVYESRYRADAEAEASRQQGFSRSYDRWTHDREAFEIGTEEMVAATLDKSFEDELSAIGQWFRVLSDAERTSATYTCLRQLTPAQLRFFIQVLPLILTSLADQSDRLPDALVGLDTSAIGVVFPDRAAMTDEREAELAQIQGSPAMEVSHSFSDDREQATSEALSEDREIESRPTVGSSPSVPKSLSSPAPSSEALKPRSPVPKIAGQIGAGMEPDTILGTAVSKDRIIDRPPDLHLARLIPELQALASQQDNSRPLPSSSSSTSVALGQTRHTEEPAPWSALTHTTSAVSRPSSTRVIDVVRRLTDTIPGQDIHAFLRSIRLHRYTDNLKDLTWEEVIELNDAGLQARDVNALGARIKFLKVGGSSLNLQRTLLTEFRSLRTRKRRKPPTTT